MTDIDFEESAEAILNKRYIRIGWVDKGYRADNFAKALVKAFPGERLPPYWQYRSLEHFHKKFGDKQFHWAQTHSFHMLIYRGHRVLRIWTDCPTAAIMDISDELAVNLVQNNPEFAEKIVEIQPKVLPKCKPMKKRINIITEDDLNTVMKAVKAMYGI